MNANQITPGEWRLNVDTQTGYAKIEAGRGFVTLHNGNCDCCGFPKNSSVDQESETGFAITGYIRTADVRLMAAAPRLLEALEYAIRNVPELATVPGIAAATALAKGEPA